MSSTARGQRLLNGPLIAALLALLALAVVTVVVVLTGEDDHTVAGEAGTGNVVDPDESVSAKSDTDEPDDVDTISATDGSFTTIAPDGYLDGAGVVNDIGGMVLSLYDSATAGESLPTNIIVASVADDGTELEDAVSGIQASFASKFGTTFEDSDLGITEIDGEPTIGWQSGDYSDAGSEVNSSQFAVIHGDYYYFFTVNSLPKHKDDARAALGEIMSAVTWSDSNG